MAGMKPDVCRYKNSKIVPTILGKVDPRAEEMAWDDLKREAAQELFDVLDDGSLWTIRITRDREELPKPWEPARPPEIRLTIWAQISRIPKLAQAVAEAKRRPR